MYATKMALINYKSRKFEQRCQDSNMALKFIRNARYSETACRMECAQEIIQRECGCNCLMMDEKFLETNPGQLCQTVEVVNKCLAKNQGLQKELEQCNSDCLPPCESWTYNPSVSYVKFNKGRDSMYNFEQYFLVFQKLRMRQTETI